MANIINQKNCLTARKNLGFGDCIVEMGQITGPILVPKGWSIDLAVDTFDKDYVNEQIQAGNFNPILGASEFTDNTPEATIEEFQGGVKNVVRNGLPEFGFKYTRGGWLLANALSSWNSNEAYDILIVSKNGNIAGVDLGDGVFGAFDGGMINAGSYKQTDGAVSGSVMLTIQLLDESQYNSNVAILDRVALGFNASTEIFPLTDVLLLNGTADASDNKIIFNAVFSMNPAETVKGLDLANFKVYVDGIASPVSVSTYNTLTGKYELSLTTPPTAGDLIVVELYDDVAGYPATKVGQRYYKGKSASITTVA